MKHAAMIALFSAAFLVSHAGPSGAQTQLERLEDLGERAGVLSNQAMVGQVPALAGKLPDPTWDAPLRTAFACVLDGYTATVGAPAIDTMLDDMARALATATPATILDGQLDSAIPLPEGMSDAESQRLMGECGVIEIMLNRMAASGAMDILLQP